MYLNIRLHARKVFKELSLTEVTFILFSCFNKLENVTKHSSPPIFLMLLSNSLI